MDVAAYKGPGTGYQRKFEQPLQPGVEFTLRGRRGGWWNVELPDGTQSVEMIGITVEMPLALWQRIVNGQRLHGRFVRYVDSIGSDEDEDDEPPPS